MVLVYVSHTRPSVFKLSPLTPKQHLPTKRQLLKEAAMVKEDKKPIHIFLFDDILLEAKPISKKDLKKVSEKDKDTG